MTKQALGRGLSALIPGIKKETETIEKTGGVTEIGLDKIKQGKYQPRTDFNDVSQKELISSIKEKGVIQPILVRPSDEGYELIAGERRFRAARALGLENIPAIIKTVSNEEALELSLIENIQREELNPVEEAKAYKRLIDEFELTQEMVGEKVGKDRTSIANSLRLLNLPLDIQDKLISGEISVGHAKVILGLENPSDQKIAVEHIIKNGLSVRDTETYVANIKEPPVHKRRMAYKDPHVIAMEEHIQRVLGTQVKICQGKKKGKIEIAYYSQEDLQRILEFFGIEEN